MTADTLVRAEFDPNALDSVTLAIVDALALVTPDLARLPPLGDVVDTDALDALFVPSGVSAAPSADLRLTFPYERWLVTVYGSGEVVVRNRDTVPID